MTEKNTSRHFARTAPTEEVGRGIRVYSLGVTAADYDNDGDQDFYLTTFGESLLFRNEAGEAGAGPLHWIYKRIILYC